MKEMNINTLLDLKEPRIAKHAGRKSIIKVFATGSSSILSE
jgi:hypothetical protein